MSVLGTPWVADTVARTMRRLADVAFAMMARRKRIAFPEFPGDTTDITIPTSIAPAWAVVYRSADNAAGDTADNGPRPPVHVNFHGGGYIMRGVRLDDP